VSQSRTAAENQRVDRIIRWLEVRRDNLNALKKGRIEFDFSGPKVSAKTIEIHDPIE